MKSARGMTLLEMVIAIGLFSGIMIAIVTAIVSYYGLYYIEQASVDTSTASRAIVDAFENAGRSAGAVVGSHSFSGSFIASGPSAVIFEIPTVNEYGNLVPGVYDYLGIVASGTSAYQYVDPGQSSARPPGVRRLSGAVSSLSFAYDTSDPASASWAEVDVATAETVGARSAHAALSDRVYFRNR